MLSARCPGLSTRRERSARLRGLVDSSRRRTPAPADLLVPAGLRNDGAAGQRADTSRMKIQSLAGLEGQIDLALRRATRYSLVRGRGR
jgi:hypothetical protein